MCGTRLPPQSSFDVFTPRHRTTVPCLGLVSSAIVSVSRSLHPCRAAMTGRSGSVSAHHIEHGSPEQGDSFLESWARTLRGHVAATTINDATSQVRMDASMGESSLNRNDHTVVAGVGAAVETVVVDTDGVNRGEAEAVGAAHDRVALPFQLALDPALD